MKSNTTLLCNKMLAGLVAITAPCAFVNPMGPAIISSSMAFIYFKMSDLITPLRVSKETEIEKLDGPEMDVLGYPDFQLHPSTAGAAAVEISTAAASSIADLHTRKVPAEQN